MAKRLPSTCQHDSGSSHGWDGSGISVPAGDHPLDSLASMLRWLKSLLRRASRPPGPGVEVVRSMACSEVPPGRRRMTTTVDEFNKHLARRLAEQEQRS